RLCIQAIEEILKDNRINSVLDVGCGSGILAISAIKLGINDAVGLDIDPVAVKEAKNNLERNSVSQKIKLLCGYIDSIKERFDLIVANITVEAILLMRKELKLRLKDNGTLLVSGIPTQRRDELVSGLEKGGFVVKRELKEGEWLAYVMGIDNNSS
ncbi:MAG TPA: 50S ribosomal protein L11 methyltransferase, partial [Thermodesulfobacteriota bacterium]